MSGTASGVVVVGSLTVDLTAIADRLPALGETVLGSGFSLVAGGKGGNQAIAAARMGAPTWIVGRVGDDRFGEVVLAALVDCGVQTAFVTPVPGTASGVAHIRVDIGGQNDIVIIPLANAALSPGDVDRSFAQLRGAVSVLLVQLEIPLATAWHALRAGRAAGLTTILDPAPAPSQPVPAEVFRLIDIVTPNETEASLITGVPVTDPESAAVAGRWFIARGCGTALITLGGQGVMVVDAEHGAELVPAQTVALVDSTAAGDAFTGALGSRLARGEDLASSVVWANAAGALATTVIGASSSIPHLEQVRALIASGPPSRTDKA